MQTEFDSHQVVDWRLTDQPRIWGLKLTLDLGLGAAGVGTALASAAFAFFMLQGDIKSPRFGGAEYLLLFTRPLVPSDNRQVALSSNRDIDMTPTGSIGASKQPPRDPGVSLANPDERQEPRTALKEYKLQTVRGGVAIIDGPTGHFAVESGTLMENGDRVISIDRRGGKWVVVTTSGIIENQ